jgi:EmrB/QacA subfamily drug resistance transporter
MPFNRIEYKWIVAIVYVLGLFMNLLDTTIVNTALPTLAREFNAPATGIQWVVTGYLLSLAIFIPVSGWAGDRFGTKRIFLVALGLFTAGSALCALAWSLESLVAFRVFQGVGGGLLTPVGLAMLFRAFPPAERARAASILVIPTAVAPASGPVVGGYLVEYLTWRWIFLVNLPIGLVGLAIAALYLRESRQPDAGRFDLPGFLLAAGGLASVVFALAEAGRRGFTDPLVVATGLAGIALLAAFVVRELRTAQPMIDLRLFRDRLFARSVTVQFLSFGGLFGVIFLLPLLLQSERGLTPLESGLTTFCQALGVISMTWFSGRLYRRFGPRRLLMIGLSVIALMSLAYLRVDLETNLWWIRALLYGTGLGFSLTIVSLQTATFARIPPERTGRATAASNSVMQVAASFGVALLATILASRLGAYGGVLGLPATRDAALHAFHDAFFVGALLATVGVFAALFVDDRLAAATMRRRPEAAPQEESTPVAVG